MIGEFMDVNATIGKHAAVSIDITNAGVGGDITFQTFSEGAANAGHNLSLRQIDYRWGPRGEGRGEFNFLLSPKERSDSTPPDDIGGRILPRSRLAAYSKRFVYSSLREL